MRSGTAGADFYIDLMSCHLRAVTVELFAAYGVAIKHSAGAAAAIRAEEPHCMASIGYSGYRVRGVLVLDASQTAAEAWMAAAGGTDWGFADTLGEFSNMLLGRLKGRLLREGISISLATPMTVCGTGLRLSLPPGQSSWHFFDGAGWQLGIRLDATLECGFEPRRTDDDVEPADAGDAIVF